MAFMTAENTKLLDPLKGTYAGYNQAGQNSLADALGTLTNQAKTSQLASGRVQGQYIPQALGRANTMASQGITNSLGGALGDASLKDAQSQQEFERQMALAREIGSINSPNTLQEIIGGLSGAAGTIGSGASLYQALNRGGGATSAPGTLPPSLSLPPQYDPYDPYARYR